MEQRKIRVLIADDDLHVRSLLSILVESLDAEVLEAEDGAQALTLFEDCQPDMLLLDINMPHKNGYEVCQAVKSNPANADIPVIFITAESDSNSEVHGLELGAVDFLSKPIEPSIVLARVSTHLSLQSTRRELEEKNLILGDEKELLEDIVTKMRSSTPFDNRQIRYIQSSVDRTAGDIVLSAYRSDGAHHVMVGDFSGHGLPAAMGGILIPYIFYQYTALGNDMRTILLEVNRVLYEQLPTQLYMAVSALELTPSRKQIKVWNYGLPATMCLSKEQPLLRISSSGIPLGISNMLETFEPHRTLDLAPDSAIYLYTDGITEATAPNMEQYGTARLEALLPQIYQNNLPLQVMWDALEQHCAGQGLSDDAVLVEVKT